MLIQIIDDAEMPDGTGDDAEVVIELALKAIDSLVKLGKTFTTEYRAT